MLLNSGLESSLVALNREERQRKAFIAGSIRQEGDQSRGFEDSLRQTT